MKAKILMLFFLLMLSSCSNNDNSIYSGDSRVDSWVKENRKNFSEISLDEISNYKGEQQRAIFRLIDPVNRKEIWLEKVYKLQNLYPEQSAIFNELLVFIKNYNFETNLNDNQVAFFNSLIKSGRKKHNWNDEFIGVTLCSFEFYNSNHNYNIFSKEHSIGNPIVIGKTCNCKWGGVFACGTMECKSGCEDDGKKGCGILFMETCTGVCK